MQTEPCPALPNGERRQCSHCLEDIEIGAAATRNTHNVFIHAECANRGDELHLGPPRASASARVNSEAGPLPPGDLGDRVVAILDAGRHTFAASRPAAPSDANTADPRLGGDLGDRVVAILEAGRGGSRHAAPAAALTPKATGIGDLGDQVVASMAAKRGRTPESYDARR